MSAPCNCICCFLNAWIKYLCYAIVNARTMILIPFGWSHFFHFFISLTRLFVQQSRTSSTNCCDHSFRQISLVIVLKLMWVLARLLTDLHTLIVICFWFIRQLVKSFHSFHWSPCTNQMVGGGGGGGSDSVCIYSCICRIEKSVCIYSCICEIEKSRPTSGEIFACAKLVLPSSGRGMKTTVTWQVLEQNWAGGRGWGERE